MGRWVGWAMAGLGASGLLALVLYAARSGETVSVLGAGLLIIGATLAVGGAVGFLFGIPKTFTGRAEETWADGQEPPERDIRPYPRSGGQSRYAANTNLEQVSDWLTKLLIGAGLTQLGALSRYFKRLADTLAPSLGGRDDSAAFAAMMVTEFLLLGFLGGWLATRLLLASALSRADHRALAAFVQAQSLSERGDHREADDLRARAMSELGLPHVEADRYDDMRRLLMRGNSRTTQMQALVDAARASAPDTDLRLADIRDLFTTGGEGHRIYALALLQGAPDPAGFDLALDAIENSRSAFEQYQALVLAELLTPSLPPLDRDRLNHVLTTQLGVDGWLSRSASRRRIAERILAVEE
ncbi:hypothetical protein ACFO3J_30960 [Streptomyces polygonati]|uniref:Secreted protein n=1 Tax=Streptomyces polygonati TaxID=1617087 RepID=A0ABV8HV10_9ACTN